MRGEIETMVVATVVEAEGEEKAERVAEAVAMVETVHSRTIPVSGLRRIAYSSNTQSTSVHPTRSDFYAFFFPLNLTGGHSGRISRPTQSNGS